MLRISELISDLRHVEVTFPLQYKSLRSFQALSLTLIFLQDGLSSETHCTFQSFQIVTNSNLKATPENQSQTMTSPGFKVTVV